MYMHKKTFGPRSQFSFVGGGGHLVNIVHQSGRNYLHKLDVVMK